MSNKNAWYIRHGGKVLGPFPAGQIAQTLIIGRYKLQDEVSLDRQEWKPIREVPELVPEVMLADPEDAEAHARLESARRWADERRGERRHSGLETRKATERRESESYAVKEYREHRELHQQELLPKRKYGVVQILVVAVVLIGITYLALLYTPQEVEQAPQCTASASPGVNWRHCRLAGLQSLRSDLQGAQLDSAVLKGANLFGSNLSQASLDYAELGAANLSYVDFVNASLKGTDLSGTDLSHANLTRADLSYANLTNANIEAVNLRDARLDNAIWVDGRTCLAGSLGQCRVLPETK